MPRFHSRTAKIAAKAAEGDGASDGGEAEDEVMAPAASKEGKMSKVSSFIE